MPFYDSITEFIFVEQEPEKADIIFVPGGNYPDAAMQAARLYRDGLAPYVLPSGRYSIVKGKFVLPEAVEAPYETEWEYLKDILTNSGVPEAAVLKEDQATYTYENAIYSRKVTDALGIPVRKAIISCQAFHARRCLLYYQEQFPATQFLVCPVVTQGVSRENWYRTEHGIKTVLGEVERCGTQFHEIMKRVCHQKNDCK